MSSWFLPTARLGKVAANCLAGGGGKHNVAVKADEAAVVGKIGDRLYVLETSDPCSISGRTSEWFF